MIFLHFFCKRKIVGFFGFEFDPVFELKFEDDRATI